MHGKNTYSRDADNVNCSKQANVPIAEDHETTRVRCLTCSKSFSAVGSTGGGCSNCSSEQPRSGFTVQASNGQKLNEFHPHCILDGCVCKIGSRCVEMALQGIYTQRKATSHIVITNGAVFTPSQSGSGGYVRGHVYQVGEMIQSAENNLSAVAPRLTVASLQPKAPLAAKRVLACEHLVGKGGSYNSVLLQA